MNADALIRTLLEDDFEFDVKQDFASGPFGPVQAKVAVEERYSPQPTHTRQSLKAAYPGYAVDDVSGFLNGLDSHRMQHLLSTIESSPHPRVQFVVVSRVEVGYVYKTAGMPLKMSKEELMELLASRNCPPEVEDMFNRLNPLKFYPVLLIMKSDLRRAIGGAA